MYKFKQFIKKLVTIESFFNYLIFLCFVNFIMILDINYFTYEGVVTILLSLITTVLLFIGVIILKILKKQGE